MPVLPWIELGIGSIAEKFLLMLDSDWKFNEFQLFLRPVAGLQHQWAQSGFWWPFSKGVDLQVAQRILIRAKIPKPCVPPPLPLFFSFYRNF